MIEKLSVHCECGAYYNVQHVKTMKAQSTILDYAVCPECGTPRNPEVWKHVSGLKICGECKIPTKRLVEGLCVLHYMRKYRGDKKQKLQQESI